MRKWGLVACLLVLAGCSSFRGDMHWKVADFNYTNQHQTNTSLASLQGTPFIAYFFFTNCTTVCPPMTMNMVKLQKELKAAGMEDYALVGFSVDPTRDTPAVITQYINQFPVADKSKWHLLTGYDEAAITTLAATSFKAIVKREEGSQQMMHATNFYLVDQQGFVRKSYDGYGQVPVSEILNDLAHIQPK